NERPTICVVRRIVGSKTREITSCHCSVRQRWRGCDLQGRLPASAWSQQQGATCRQHELKRQLSPHQCALLRSEAVFAGMNSVRGTCTPASNTHKGRSEVCVRRNSSPPPIRSSVAGSQAQETTE